MTGIQVTPETMALRRANRIRLFSVNVRAQRPRLVRDWAWRLLVSVVIGATWWIVSAPFGIVK